MRIRVAEGAIGEQDVEAIVVEPGDERPPGRACIEAADARGDEESVRTAIRACLSSARERGLRSLALPPLGAGPGRLSLQRSAEILFDEAHRHSGEETPLEELRFVVVGEPALRVFEQVQDAEKIRAGLALLRR